jgi:peptidoglycan hydrolase-like protein with peptidoglycan-binding domain
VRGEVLGATDGEVLGAFTGSCPYLTTYMRMGQTNDVEEVKKLQQFLSENLSIDLPVTGFFGEMTDKAVRNFQLKMKDNILLPWVEVGLHDSVENSTGYVYKTTQYAINKIVCPDMDFAKPVLN